MGLIKRKVWAVILLIITVSFINSCGNSSGQGNSINSNKNNNLEVSPTAENPNIKSYMTFDVLGGVFRKTGDGAAGMLLDEGESSKGFLVDKTSLSLPPPPIPQANASNSPFTIDSSSQYLGYQGKGRLTISALGSGEEVTQSTKDIIRQFSSLTLRFVFHKFGFNNTCLGLVYLDGEIECDVRGDYELSNQNFLGEAHCSNGPKTNPAPLIYITDQKNYSVELDANLKIDGDIYLYKSYSYDGSITIDGEKGAINDLIGKGGSCSL